MFINSPFPKLATASFQQDQGGSSDNRSPFDHLQRLERKRNGTTRMEFFFLVRKAFIALSSAFWRKVVRVFRLCPGVQIFRTNQTDRFGKMLQLEDATSYFRWSRLESAVQSTRNLNSSPIFRQEILLRMQTTNGFLFLFRWRD